MYLAQHNVPALHCLLEQSLKWHMSAAKTLALFEQAVQGTYSPHGRFMDKDIDVAFLLKAFGGSKLLYAFQKHCSFASESTIQHHLNGPEILAAIGKITADYIDANIQASLSSSIKPPPPDPRFGNIIMVNNVTLEEHI